MNRENHFIEKVYSHPYILSNETIIFSKAGVWNEYFGNTSPLVLEIGTGMGNFFGTLVSQERDKNFIGIEMRYKRIFTTAEKALTSCKENSDSQINFAVLKQLGQNIGKIFGENELSETYLFFPDPYSNKTRQLKHRLVQEEFLHTLSHTTCDGGCFFFKTDHDEYLEWTKNLIESSENWEIELYSNDYEKSDFFEKKSVTEFEALYRGKNKNIGFIKAKNKKNIENTEKTL